MARITVEDCLEKVNNRFILVHMANHRTRAMIKGAPPLVHSPENREVVVSLREVAQGKAFIDEENRKELIENGFLYVQEHTGDTEDALPA